MSAYHDDATELTNLLFDTDPPLLLDQEAGAAMRCPACDGDTTRDWETGEYLADDCGVCGGSGWLPEEEPAAAYQLAALDVEDRGRR
jgi:hypothetical protein